MESLSEKAQLAYTEITEFSNRSAHRLDLISKVYGIVSGAAIVPSLIFGGVEGATVSTTLGISGYLILRTLTNNEEELPNIPSIQYYLKKL